MYGCVVHKRVWKEVPKENTPMLSTSQSRQPSPSLVSSSCSSRGPATPLSWRMGFFRFRRAGPRRRPESLSPCLLHLHTMLETSARHNRIVLLLALRLPLNYLLSLFSPPVSRRIIGISLIRPSVEIVEGETKMSMPRPGFGLKMTSKLIERRLSKR